MLPSCVDKICIALLINRSYLKELSIVLYVVYIVHIFMSYICLLVVKLHNPAHLSISVVEFIEVLKSRHTIYCIMWEPTYK